jgi:hypothetical protein
MNIPQVDLHPRNVAPVAHGEQTIKKLHRLTLDFRRMHVPTMNIHNVPHRYSSAAIGFKILLDVLVVERDGIHCAPIFLPVMVQVIKPGRNVFFALEYRL